MTKIVSVIFFCILFIGCNDPDPIVKGINTNVYGKLSDFNDKPVVNAKVKVGEYRFERNYTNGGMDYFNRWIDSTYSNENGNYQFNFTTTGNGTSYKLVFDNPDVEAEQTYLAYEDVTDIEPLGKDFEFNSKNFYNLYTCEVDLDLQEVTQFPIYVDHYTTRYDFLIKIPKTDNYKLKIYIVKDWWSNGELHLINTKGRFTYKLEGNDKNNLKNIQLKLSDADFVSNNK